MSDPRTLAESEWQTISEAIARHNGNKTAAARELGISRSTILRKESARKILAALQNGARENSAECAIPKP